MPARRFLQLLMVLACLFSLGIAGVAPASESVNVLDVPVAASSDDAKEAESGSVSTTSSDLELVNDGSNQTVGIRFAGVSVAQGRDDPPRLRAV